MIISVFSGLRWFVLFFLLFITTFAVLLNIVFNGEQYSEDNNGIMGFFILAFRTSVGDFAFIDY